MLNFSCAIRCLVAFLFLFSLLADTSTASGSEQRNVPVSEQETLKFLVDHSDIIAIVRFDKTVNDSLFSLFFSGSNPTASKVEKVIKGDNISDSIPIYSETKFPAQGALKNKVVFRQGRNLVFLCRDGKYYRPTTRFSVLEISNNRVYPIWKQNDDMNGFQYGYLLSEIVRDIKEMSLYNKNGAK